ncbi:MAG: sulfurtransferase TusA family protein [Proteobacteria bacterium]|nr:sulfurtransferase TusA family protein [Pseudomonadota bacterium]MBU4469674.1 sulfurtransferase TusA family protein [Pseudomonadota bacterium]MCG2751757.1 sulfurtransferase TusA family protein [Desulfobacteraceae bacterium]
MDIKAIKPNQTLDTRGLACPMPLLKTKKVLKDLGAGEILEVLGTDPGSKNDIPHFADKGGNKFLGLFDDAEGFTRYFIKKGA